MLNKLVSDRFRSWAGPIMHKGIFKGQFLCGAPFEMDMVFDFTGLRGSGSNIYYSIVYQLPKWGYKVTKVDEALEVSPVFADYYNLTLAQKQKLMETIKGGLTSAAQAVGDYELLAHDARRYKEILDYFKKAQKDQHVLRSLFVDRVDAHTGEGYSLITMARRWPTIISDFIRMEEKWDDVNEIREKIDVSQAEASVLKTKNELFKEWKDQFFPVVKERYARIENMVRARKKSIEEYKRWLKPYVARFKNMREGTEKSAREFVSNAFSMSPGFGQSQGLIATKIWAWKPFTPPEKGKPPALREKGKGGGFIIDPYDDVVKEWQKEIEKEYNIKIYEDMGEYTEKVLKEKYKGKTLKEKMNEKPPYTIFVRDLMKSLTEDDPYSPSMNPNVIYYILFEFSFVLSLLKTPPPKGIETDDLMITPYKAWFVSQNVLLLHLIEKEARELAFEKYIDELIGAENLEGEISKEVEEMFEEIEKPKPKSKAMEGAGKAGKKFKSAFKRFYHIFVAPGPYEIVFYERVSKMYARGLGGDFGKTVNLIKEKMKVV